MPYFDCEGEEWAARELTFREVDNFRYVTVAQGAEFEPGW